MLFMNEYDILRARQQFEHHDLLGPATQTLSNLADWANHNSDGWHSWPKPCRAAKSLQELIQEAERAHRAGDKPEVTVADVAKAYRPIKAFLTRQGVLHSSVVVALPVVSS